MTVTVSEVQSDRQYYHVIVLRRNGTEVLFIRRDDGLELPSVAIPRWQRTAENLTTKVKRKLGCDAICLFSLRELMCEVRDGELCQVMECVREARLPSDAVWVPATSLSTENFGDRENAALIQEFLAKWKHQKDDPLSPFAKPGWFQELVRWVSEVIRPLDLQLSGSFRQFNAGASFSLIRFETTGEAVWFKAVGDPNRHEFGITLQLAELFRQFLPDIVATRPDWNGWLSLEAEGRALEENWDVELWRKAASALAKLQIESLTKTNQIIASGARNLDDPALLTLVHPFFAEMSRVMKEQTKVPPPTLTEEQLAGLEETIGDRIGQQKNLDIPDTLGHLDMNPGNVVASARSSVFLDWAEAYVGNPGFTFQYFLEHCRRAFAGDPVTTAKITAAYTQEWKGLLSPTVIEEALRLSRLIAVFAYAAGTNSWRDQEKLKDPAFTAYLRSLTRRMNREATELPDRRSRCLSL